MASRIERLLNDKNGGNQSEMARFIGVSPQAVQKWIAGGSEPRGKNLEMAAEFLGVTPAFLKFGLQVERAAEMNQMPPGMMRVRAVDEDDPAITQIKKVRLKVQAGITGFQVEPEHYEGETHGVPTKWVEREGLSRSSLLVLVVKGESMVPALYEGDIIVVNTADKSLVSGSVYVINYEGEAVVKRMIRDAGQWWLTSDNSDQRKYHRQLCKGAECIVIGKVVRKESTNI
jgi:phage repressor protein C with HTH and peptisase S24 domain